MVTLWADSYTGPRWRYGLTYRPLSSATVPAGWLIDPARPSPAEGFAFGIVEYPRALTEQEVASYELTPLDRDRDADRDAAVTFA